MNFIICDESGYEPEGNFVIDQAGNVYRLYQDGRWFPCPDYIILEEE